MPTTNSELPAITAEDRELLHYNPNTNDIVEWVQDYARRAIALTATTQSAPAAAEQSEKVRKCLAFFASVIKSGERWTDHCEVAMREALAAHPPAGASAGEARIDHVECTDCGRYFRCDCGCSKPEVHYDKTTSPPAAPDPAGLEYLRDGFVTWLRAYAGGGENWREKVLMGEHDIALALWRDLHRQIARLRATPSHPPAAPVPDVLRDSCQHGTPYRYTCEKCEAETAAPVQAPPSLAVGEAPEGWISVNDRLPPGHTDFIALNRDGRIFDSRMCYGMHEPWFTYPRGDGSPSNTVPDWIDVTHWMPKPAVPQETTK